MRLSGIKNKLLILLALVSCEAFGQVTVRGRVLDKQEKSELPGASIIEKGTQNGTVSDNNGYFKLEVTDKNSILVISFIGYKPKEINIADTSFILIELKLDCLIDFFDYHDIGLGFSSGALNAPIGGYGFINFVPLKRLVGLHSEIDFQTDLSQNQKLDIRLGTLHLLADCGYDADFDFNYRTINNGDFSFHNYKVEGKINFSRPKIVGQYSTLFLGYAMSDLSKFAIDHNNNSGILMGFGKRFYRPFYINVNVKTIYWNDYWEYIGEIICRYKHFEVTANYNVIDIYRELNLRFGYIITY